MKLRKTFLLAKKLQCQFLIILLCVSLLPKKYVSSILFSCYFSIDKKFDKIQNIFVGDVCHMRLIFSCLGVQFQ
jgi:hypothetical protein